MRRLLAVLIVALAAVPAQAQSVAASKWHAAHSLWMLRGDIVSAAGVVRPGTSAGGGGGGATTIAMFDDTEITFGTGTDAGIAYNTVQTPDAWYFGVGQDSRCLIIAERTDRAFDFAHAIETNPCLIVHSAAQSTTQWIKFLHDGTNATLDAGTGGFRFNFGGVWRGGINGTVFSVTAIGQIGFHSATNLTAITNDTLFTRGGAATFVQGADVNGAAIAQTLRGCAGITGTDVAGCNQIFAGGPGTGAGAGGDRVDQTAPALATGTTAQTLGDRVRLVAKGKALTESSATNVVQIAAASGSSTGGTIEYTVDADDATDFQSRSGRVQFALVNKAGTETCTVSGFDGTTTPAETKDGSLLAASSGTLTYAWGVDTTPSNACNLTLNAVSSLTQTTLRITYQVRKNAGSGAITPQ